MRSLPPINEVAGAIFDVDDTLLDNGNRPGNYANNIHSRSRLAAVRAVGERHGIEALCTLSPQANVEAFLRSPTHTVEGGVWQILLMTNLVTGEIDPEHPLLQEIVVGKEEAYFDLLMTEGRPVPGSSEFVRGLAERGVKLAIASNAQRRAIDITLEKAGMAHLFPDERIISSERITRPKPDGEAFERAFQSLGLPDDARPYVLAFEDDPRGFESARRTGLFVCGIATRHAVDSLMGLPEPPDYAADSYEEYAKQLGLPMAVA